MNRNLLAAPSVSFNKKADSMKPISDQPPIVLVVDDDPDLRDFAEIIIAGELGYRTLVAGTAREAIAFLKEVETIDVMFTDITLPDGTSAIDGLELARKAVELHPRLRVIYTTGGGQPDNITVRFVEDASFLPKPYTARQLMRALSQHLAPDSLAANGTL